MPVIGIDHIEIIVPDVKAYVTFMQGLGFNLIRWTDHHEGSAELQLPGEDQPIFELHQLLIEENPGINHIAFKVTGLEEIAAKLESDGVKFYKGIHQSMTGRRKVDIQDPIGLRFQLVDENRAEVADKRDIYGN